MQHGRFLFRQAQAGRLESDMSENTIQSLRVLSLSNARPLFVWGGLPAVGPFPVFAVSWASSGLIKNRPGASSACSQWGGSLPEVCCQSPSLAASEASSEPSLFQLANLWLLYRLPPFVFASVAFCFPSPQTGWQKIFMLGRAMEIEKVSDDSVSTGWSHVRNAQRQRATLNLHPCIMCYLYNVYITFI